MFKEQYRRLMVDKGRCLVPESLQNSMREARSRTNSESHSSGVLHLPVESWQQYKLF